MARCRKVRCDTACSVVDDPCTLGSRCCSGVCGGGTCRIAACRRALLACTATRQCRSNRCSGGICQPY